MKIGFIGLGNMGSGIAHNLQQYCKANSHQLYVLDLNQAAVDKIVEQGALAGESIKQVAADCDLLFTSLPSAKEIDIVATGELGILQNAKPNQIWFETSTNELAEWQKIKDLAPDSMTLIDAPVTGGAEGAAAGTLTMLVGIDDESILDSNTKLAELLASFTNKVALMGPSGAGYVTKLSQLHLNYLVAQGIGEALMLGKKAGIDLNNLWSVLKTSCAQSYVVDAYIPMVLDGSYDPSFALGLATKDMRLITDLGNHLNVDLELANKVYETYVEANEKHGFDAPHLSVLKLIEEKSDQELR